MTNPHTDGVGMVLGYDFRLFPTRKDARVTVETEGAKRTNGVDRVQAGRRLRN